MRTPSWPLRALPAVLVLAAAGCGGNTLGSLGDILGQPSGAQSGQLSAEVRNVDTSRQEIQVTTQDGRTGYVQFDQNTVVVYRQQQYAVTALERGDLVTLSVQQDARGNLYATRIDVTQSVQDRTGSTNTSGSNLLQFQGRISTIDHDRGTMLIQTQNGNVTAALPYNPPRATLDYFHRLRVGDTIRLEATMIGTNRVEIYRFL